MKEERRKEERSKKQERRVSREGTGPFVETGRGWRGTHHP